MNRLIKIVSQIRYINSSIQTLQKPVALVPFYSICIQIRYGRFQYKPSFQLWNMSCSSSVATSIRHTTFMLKDQKRFVWLRLHSATSVSINPSSRPFHLCLIWQTISAIYDHNNHRLHYVGYFGFSRKRARRTGPQQMVPICIDTANKKKTCRSVNNAYGKQLIAWSTSIQ